MFEKIYPNVVTLKKHILTVVLLFVCLMISLILYFLAKSPNPHSLKNGSLFEAHQPASIEDARYIKAHHVTAIKNSASEIPSMQPHQNLLKNNVFVKEERIDIEKHDDESLKKAMSAAITSNQLIADNALKVNPNAPDHQNGVGLQNNFDPKQQFLNSQRSTSDHDYLSSTLHQPINHFELQAGSIIPATLITGINSDLPGQITAQVRNNVYDSISGKHLLIPQGAKLTGLYDSQIAYGQARVLVVWQRIIFPSGESINLQRMPGVDISGYAGFQDKINHHYSKMFNSVLLLSALGGGAQLAIPVKNGSANDALTIQQSLAQSLGTNLAETATTLTSKNFNIQPTLEIEPGYEFNVSVTSDIVFPHPYSLT